PGCLPPTPADGRTLDRLARRWPQPATAVPRNRSQRSLATPPSGRAQPAPTAQPRPCPHPRSLDHRLISPSRRPHQTRHRPRPSAAHPQLNLTPATRHTVMHPPRRHTTGRAAKPVYFRSLLGRVPRITGDGLRDPDGSRQGGGRLSYRAYSSGPTTQPGGHLGAKTAVADPRDT